MESAPNNEEYHDRDSTQKYQSIERKNSRRNAKESLISIGDTVLMQNLNPENQLSTTYAPTEFTVLNKEGSRVTVKHNESGKVFQRNSAHLKRIVQPPEGDSGPEPSVSSTPQVHPTDPPVEIPDAREMADLAARPKRSLRRPLKLDDYVE